MPSLISEYEPQFVTGEESARRVRAARVAWAAVAGLAALLVGLIVAAPLLRASGALELAEGIYRGFGAVCHQAGERSFHAAGHPLAVCARCFGLYFGALAGVAVYPLARPLAGRETPRRAWLILAAVPTCVDFALGFFGLWENTHLSRFLTALLLGVVSAFYIVPGIVDLSLTPRGRLFRQGLPRES
jgi:uncharacterized membrane protein